jgi:hypothetical protein
LDKTIKPQQATQGPDSQSEDPIVPTAPNGWADIFAALDKAGVPEDFLSPSERAQEPPQERDFLWDKPKR